MGCKRKSYGRKRKLNDSDGMAASASDGLTQRYKYERYHLHRSQTNEVCRWQVDGAGTQTHNTLYKPVVSILVLHLANGEES